jgi:hypothetical protein
MTHQNQTRLTVILNILFGIISGVVILGVHAYLLANYIVEDLDIPSEIDSIQHPDQSPESMLSPFFMIVFMTLVFYSIQCITSGIAMGIMASQHTKRLPVIGIGLGFLCSAIGWILYFGSFSVESLNVFIDMLRFFLIPGAWLGFMYFLLGIILTQLNRLRPRISVNVEFEK